jgi:hypothetical protein
LLLFVSPAQAAAGERAWRGVEINSTQWLVARHSEQLERSATTLTAQQYLELLEYRQMLRDWPAAPEFPDISQRPKAPDWLATQTQ